MALTAAGSTTASTLYWGHSSALQAFFQVNHLLLLPVTHTSLLIPSLHLVSVHLHMYQWMQTGDLPAAFKAASLTSDLEKPNYNQASIRSTQNHRQPHCFLPEYDNQPLFSSQNEHFSMYWLRAAKTEAFSSLISAILASSPVFYLITEHNILIHQPVLKGFHSTSSTCTCIYCRHSVQQCVHIVHQ